MACCHGIVLTNYVLLGQGSRSVWDLRSEYALGVSLPASQRPKTASKATILHTFGVQVYLKSHNFMDSLWAGTNVERGGSEAAKLFKPPHLKNVPLGSNVPDHGVSVFLYSES